jgi:hypothetical protein
MKTAVPALATCYFIALFAGATARVADDQSRLLSGDSTRLIGTWRLVSFESNDQENPRARGAHPIGLIFYDATGHMSAQIMPDRPRRKFTGSPSPVFAGPQPTAEEAIDAILGYTAYFGHVRRVSRGRLTAAAPDGGHGHD